MLNNRRSSARVGDGCGFCGNHVSRSTRQLGLAHPFLLGLLVGVAGYILRRYVLDRATAEKRRRAPIVETLHDHWRIVVGFIGLTLFAAVTYLLGFLYLVSWMQTADGIPPARALEINSFSMMVMMVVVIAAGFLSDWFGRKPLLLLSSILGFVGALPSFWLLNHPSALLAQLGQLGLVFTIGLYGGTLPAFLVEAAPPRVRCTAVALGYNVCLGVFGGLSPLVATWLIKRTGDEIAPAFLIMASAAVSLLTVFWFRETARIPFGGAASGGAVA
jgi:MFS transporter, MHS family, proline/betaine transporter